MNRSVIEVWGTVDAPDGTAVRLALRSASRRGDPAAAPVVTGRFYGKLQVPADMRGLPVTVSAALVR